MINAVAAETVAVLTSFLNGLKLGFKVNYYGP